MVRVEACALNRLDAVQRHGWYQLPGFAYPHIAGMDVAGTVVSVADDVTDGGGRGAGCARPLDGRRRRRLELAGRGDLSTASSAVIGATVDGGYAELCLAPASHVYPVPDDMPIEHAATFPTCYLTAAHGLFEVGKLVAGETVLIHAAGSGVSVAAIHSPSTPERPCSPPPAATPSASGRWTLGADHVLNNRTGDVAGWAREVTGGAGVRMVFDHVGTALFPASLYALGVRGRLVNCGNSSGDTATIPSLGYVYHHGISILGSDPYRPEEFGPAWRTFCEQRFRS